MELIRKNNKKSTILTSYLLSISPNMAKSSIPAFACKNMHTQVNVKFIAAVDVVVESKDNARRRNSECTARTHHNNDTQLNRQFDRN